VNRAMAVKALDAIQEVASELTVKQIIEDAHAPQEMDAIEDMVANFSGDYGVSEDRARDMIETVLSEVGTYNHIQRRIETKFAVKAQG